MDDETGESENRSASNSAREAGEGVGEADADLSTILSYLIRSGQVRVMSSSEDGGMRLVDNDDMDDDDDVDPDVGPAPRGIPDPSPDTSALESSELKQELLEFTARSNDKKKSHLPHMLLQRESGLLSQQRFSQAQCCRINSNYLPNEMDTVAMLRQKVFCGTYSTDGNIFLSACQDRNLRIYDTRFGEFEQIKCIEAHDVGWSVLDTAFSPDGNYLVYSSWSDCLHLCNVHGSHEVHDMLPMEPELHRSFSIFSLQFSADNEEIMGGANDGHLYIYDRQRNQRTLRIETHEDDVNAVCFADTTSQILFSGGDDGLVKVWDRRTLSEFNPQPVGVLAGHMDGITFIDTRGDTRYLLSNSKDQSIKLWDMRKFSSKAAQDNTRRIVSNASWDYRWQAVPKKVKGKRKRLAGDSSLMSYCGHTVQHTLIRARFSPQFTTGARYIYTGCASGAVVIYDVLSGEIVSTLSGQHGCVRDVSWHPFENVIMSSSWDGSIGKWSYQMNEEDDDTANWVNDSSETDSDDSHGARRKVLSRKPKKQRGVRGSGFSRRFSGIMPW